MEAAKILIIEIEVFYVRFIVENGQSILYFSISHFIEVYKLQYSIRFKSCILKIYFLILIHLTFNLTSVCHLTKITNIQ